MRGCLLGYMLLVGSAAVMTVAVIVFGGLLLIVLGAVFVVVWTRVALRREADADGVVTLCRVPSRREKRKGKRGGG